MLRIMVIRGGGNYKVVSESDAIIEYMMKEADQYKNIVFNESYIDEQEKLVMEAKYDAILEAVSGGIIAIIIALLGAIIALLVKFSSSMKSGGSIIENNKKQIRRNMDQSNNNDSDTNDNKREKLMKKQQDTFNRYYKENIDILKRKFEKGSFSFNGTDSVEFVLGVLINRDLDKYGKENLNYNSCRGLSGFKITERINADIFKEMEMHMSGILGLNVNADKYRDVDRWVKSTTDKLYDLLNTKLFMFNKDIPDIEKRLVEAYNHFTVEDCNMLVISYYFSDKKYYYDAVKVQQEMNSDLKSMEDLFNEYKSKEFNLKKIEAKDITGYNLSQDKINREMNYYNKWRDAALKSYDMIKDVINESNKFMKEWFNIEAHRMKLVLYINKLFERNYDLAAKQNAYLCVKRIFNRDELFMKQPVDDYESLKMTYRPALTNLGMGIW